VAERVRDGPVSAKLLLHLLLPAGLLVVLLLPVGAATQEVATETAAKGPDDLLRGFTLTSQQGPVTIRANKLEFDYRSRVLTYRGTVSVTQADLTMHSDLLRVTLDPEARQPVQKIEAEGAVRIAKGAREATGGRAVFDQAKRTVVLSDNARLRDGPNEVAGERVVVYLDEERSVVEGGNQRVRAVLYPPEGKDEEEGRADE
jgi:lipopolysaccharide export system protein LptA